MKIGRLFFLVLLTVVACKRPEPEIIEHIVEKLDTIETIIVIGNIPGRIVSIQEFGVLPTNSAAVNKQKLQEAIDYAQKDGLALYVTPVENGYPMDGGLVLKRNVSLVGAHGPTGRGTANRDKTGPTGSLFVIRDRENVFLTVESATQVQGIQFWYPDQTWNDPSKIIPYPTTIQGSREHGPQGVTLRDLSFYGEYRAMDFRMPSPGACEQILFENCYGYPLSGEFIAVGRCYDIPRILHCHVNPANQREFGRGFSATIVDKVVAQKTYAYSIETTDNAVLMDIFTYGSYGGIYLGEHTYGQLTDFNFDCVTVGIYRTDDGGNNRTWQIAQGSIIANQGAVLDDVHPIIITGLRGHTSLTNVDCFSGRNGGTVCVGASKDFLYLPGEGLVTVTMTGCKMSGYTAGDPVTLENPLAFVRALGCFDKDGLLYEKTIPSEEIFDGGIRTMLDDCDANRGWKSDLTLSIDATDKKQGAACLSGTGSGVGLFTRVWDTPVDAKVSHQKGGLHLWLYLSDATALDLNAEGAIEVTSSGTCDKKEYAWYLSGMGLKTGWNELWLPFSKAGITGGRPDLAAMDYLRIYHTKIQRPLTLKIDDVCFYQD